MKLTPNSIRATIIPDYQHGAPGTSNKVDFVIHVNPNNETPPKHPSPAAAAIERLVHQLPGRVFNFTDLEPVQDRPIALSIETKKPTEGFDVAKLQLGVWNAPAQAKEKQSGLTQEPARVQVQHIPIRENQPTFASQNTVQRNAPRFKPPDFLPGVIINGHNPWFTATTFDGSRVSFWEKAPL
ncbi:hypothetical protein CEP54_013627 [Fusarium duplospermum]|uniref:PD-(D/E)XK nuclease-like domain-containing protein n=1 Tax=Fusarium duplospermum TaxID=1325734 RepID=A0A428P1Q7_9HYPO|nr:hypothetical protein CEP54_013627 [Fusarium duplospermum]